jgi:hypothetical protein
MEKSLPQLILPIKLERSPERLTSLGGLVVLEELARAVGLWELRAEQDVLEEFGLEAVPDAGTVGDWLRRQARTGAEAIQQVSRELVERCLGREPEDLVLDVDATEIEADKQEAQWTYSRVHGYMPLLGYVNGGCVGHRFREGNQNPSAGILEFAHSCEAALPEGK